MTPDPATPNPARVSGIRRLRPILLAIEAGSQVTTFGDMLVVAHPAHPPEIYDRHSGQRLAIGGFDPRGANVPGRGAEPMLRLEPIPDPERPEGLDLRHDLRRRPS